MEELNSFHLKTSPRDIYRYIRLRAAEKSDDLKVGLLLVKTFLQTHSLKLPHAIPNEKRIAELQSVEQRRNGGEIYVLELAEETIIGTFGLIHPESSINQSWLSNSANLRCVAIDPRFQGIGLSDLLLKMAVDRAKKWRASYIALHVHKGATGVANLYKKYGFQRDTKGDCICENGYHLEGYRLGLHFQENN